MINTRFIWYLDKSGILDRCQCGFRRHRSTMDHLVSLERYVRDAFARKQQAFGLFFDLEKAYETTWQYGILRDLHRIRLRGRLPVFVLEYLRERRIRARIGTTLSDEFYPEEGVPTGGVLAVTMVVSCMAQHQNQPATTGQHPKHWIKTVAWSILHQPSLQFVCWDQWSSLGGTSAKAVHELLSQNTCLHWKSGTSCPARIRPNHQRSVCPQAKWARRHVPTPNTSCRPLGWGSRGICGDQCWFDSPLEATKFPARNTQIRPVKTQPHWRSKQMYDFQRRSPSQIQWVLWHSRTTWWSLYRWIQDRRESGCSSGHQPPFPEWWDNLPLLSKRLPDNSTIFAAEATAITLALDYYQHMEPVRHDVVVYSDPMSCLQAI